MNSNSRVFEETMLPHLDAAYNLARWLTRNDQDARDVVQESYLRAFRFFERFRGGDGRAWMLEIVRNTFRNWHHRARRDASSVPFDEAAHAHGTEPIDPERQVDERKRAEIVRGCIEDLPVEFREAIVMRELEEMSYREIADVTGVAIGTVMSRLARARKRLEDCAGRRSKGAAR